MRRIDNLRSILLALALSALACGEENNPVGPYRPYTFTVESGDGQVASAGMRLEPLLVLVADGDGVGVDGADVVWTVTSGGGLFRVPVGDDFELVDAYANQTGEDGRAAAELVLTELGTTTVAAYATRPTRIGLGSVEFTASAGATAIVLDSVGDWRADWPRGVADVTVELGTPLEWHAPDRCCDDHIRSISVPAGGTTFDARLTYDSVFAFVPDVSGEWRWEWERTDGDWWWPETLTDTLSFFVR